MGTLLGLSTMLRRCSSLLLCRFLDYTHASHQATQVRSGIQLGKSLVHARVRKGISFGTSEQITEIGSFASLAKLRNLGRPRCAPQAYHIERTVTIHSGLARQSGIDVVLRYRREPDLSSGTHVPSMLTWRALHQKRAYLATLICAVIQLAALVSYLVAYFP